LLELQSRHDVDVQRRVDFRGMYGVRRGPVRILDRRHLLRALHCGYVSSGERVVGLRELCGRDLPGDIERCIVSIVRELFAGDVLRERRERVHELRRGHVLI